MTGTARRVTSADVAREAGVSRATVSYVLNDTPHQKIPQQTRERVLEAAQRLAYSPSPAARSLRNGRSDLVLGVLKVGPIGSVVGALLNAMSTRFGTDGLTFAVHLHSPGLRPVSDVWKAVTPAAVVVLSGLDAAEQADLQRSGTPVLVSLSPAFTPHPLLDGSGTRVVCVEYASRAAAALQVEHLVATGHRRIAVVTLTDPQVRQLAEGRLDAALEAAHEAGLPAPHVVEVADDSPQAVAAAVRTWQAEGVTGVVTYNDEVAMAVLSAARDAGLRVPEDLAVIGLDDLPAARSAQPPLTTVGLDAEALADFVGRSVAAVLAGDPDVPEEPTTGFAHLVRRASA
ncbi:LacI family transcriptional regulator [Paenibacillus sp. TRM 82003]|uniref:LacI family DNA-binding transcriptional regulator n=1 Tax=Kineococcus sp. TRM81007 TaxID=2925831 RepID=UPI001F59452C|nr:LacI family DNA-binding transcriptional regulator [Kineococcus sp. TRM81007]MCI2237753.1 LacI family transcriptional regulator [Kineococcus sp. TRM81007]MCI3921771.1 LacI family transcriptional regulator [Paenibacillus sp. TRM 82003]